MTQTMQRHFDDNGPRAARRIASRAIVIDFEGEGVNHGAGAAAVAPPPSVLGVLHPGGYRAWVIDSGLAPLVTGRRRIRRGLARQTSEAELATVLEWELDRAEREERAIAFFSQHEPTATGASLGDGHPVIARLERRAVDVKRVLDRFVGINRIARPKERSLEGYATLQCPDRTAHPVAGSVGHTIRRLRRSVGGARRWADCPRIARGQWEWLLDEDRDDCRLTGMVLLVALAADRAGVEGLP